MPRKQRLSNIELLRILSMVMILVVHIDGASLGQPAPSGDLSSLTGRQVWQLAVESFSIIGVNLFTLISGYFGIRLSVKSASSFLFQCLFYAVGIATVAPLFLHGHFSWTQWGDSWLILTHTDLWYVPCYFLLMLLSPALNAGLKALNLRQCLVTTGLFAAYTLWVGWWWGKSFNPTGYTIMQLILVYMIGHCISRIPALTQPSRRRSVISLVAYLITTAAVFLSALYLPPLKAFAYNSPLVMAASVALFLCFRAMKFQSPAINYIAKSSFAVYLLHKNPLIWVSLMRPTVVDLWRSTTLLEFSLLAVAAVIAIYLISMIIDALRRALFRPILQLINQPQPINERSQ